MGTIYDIAKNNFLKNSAIKDIVYHSTNKPFDDTVIKGGTGTWDRLLGAHFSKDPRVGDAFTIGDYARKNTWGTIPQIAASGKEVMSPLGFPVEAGGRVYPGFLNINPKVVPQVDKMSKSGIPLFDQWAVSRDVSNEVFPRRKDLFVKWMTEMRGKSEKTAETMWEELRAGTNKQYKDFDDFISKDVFPTPYSADFTKSMINEYREALAEKGFNGLQYRNTGPAEARKGVDPTSYIAFEPETQFKSQFNKGAFNPRDPDMLKGAVGLMGGGAALGAAGSANATPMDNLTANQISLYQIPPKMVDPRAANQQALQDAWNPAELAAPASLMGGRIANTAMGVLPEIF